MQQEPLSGEVMWQLAGSTGCIARGGLVNMRARAGPDQGALSLGKHTSTWTPIIIAESSEGPLCDGVILRSDVDILWIGQMSTAKPAAHAVVDTACVLSNSRNLFHLV